MFWDVGGYFGNRNVMTKEKDRNARNRPKADRAEASIHQSARLMVNDRELAARRAEQMKNVG